MGFLSFILTALMFIGIFAISPEASVGDIWDIKTRYVAQLAAEKEHVNDRDGVGVENQNPVVSQKELIERYLVSTKNKLSPSDQRKLEEKIAAQLGEHLISDDSSISELLVQTNAKSLVNEELKNISDNIDSGKIDIDAAQIVAEFQEDADIDKERVSLLGAVLAKLLVN